jgi:hypothetical protein
MSNGHPNVAAIRVPPVVRDPLPYEVVFTVTAFQNLIGLRGNRPAETAFTMSMPSPDLKRCYLYPDPNCGPLSIRVLCPGAALRFRVVGADGEAYMAVGVTFTNQTTTRAVACETGSGHPGNTPFGMLELVNSELFFADSLPGAAAKPQAFTFYKFSVLIQRVSNGALGLIDPGVENENLA